MDVEDWDLRWLGSKVPTVHLGLGASMAKYLHIGALSAR